MINRAVTPKLKQLARKFPVVGLLRPRQSGKTTLARELFPKKPHVSFENQDIVQMVLIAIFFLGKFACRQPLINNLKGVFFQEFLHFHYPKRVFLMIKLNACCHLPPD